MNEMIESMPICVARKPFEGTVAQNVLEHGTGALNIDACRIGRTVDDVSGWSQSGSNASENRAMSGANYARRWPANLIHDGSKEVIDLFPYTTSGAMLKPYTYTNTGFSLGKPTGATRQIHESSEGRASRFFYCCKDKMELKDYLIKLVTPSGGITLDPFKGENMKDNYLLLLGKSEEVLKSLKDNSVDSIVTDPPYELGFMGKKWDNTGIAYNVEIWKECLRVLKPGGHLLSFGGTRTSHRMVCAIEDAGFEIRDSIIWMYATGFPKSLNVSKAIDKAAGVEREVVGEYETHDIRNNGLMDRKPLMTVNITAPATPEAKQWDGWGTALKPAHEPITVARKPFEGTVAQNVLEHGTGALNIDVCRIEYQSEIDKNKATPGGKCTVKDIGIGGYSPDAGRNIERIEFDRPEQKGRFPANIIHDGSKEVTDLFPKSSSPQETTNCGKFKIPPGAGGTMGAGWYGDRIIQGYGDIGSAARFFYCAKASKSDRDEGCEDMPEQNVSYMNTHGGDADKGDDRTGETRDRFQATMRNIHPTVKPTELMKYLVRLVTQPKGTILDPFCGSGSTGKAAIIEGFKFIGIDSDPVAIDIAKRRIHNVSRKRLRVDIWDNILS